MGKEAPRSQDRPPDVSLQANTMPHPQDRPPDLSIRGAPVDLKAYIHVIPRLLTHCQDDASTRDHTSTPTTLVHLDFRYCDVNHFATESNVLRCPASEHDPGPAIQVNSVKIELSGNEYDQIMLKRELEQYVARVRTRYK